MTGPQLPPLTQTDSVRLLPLGGLGEIGLNLLVVETAGKIVIVDCGLMFPDANMLGIDFVLPDVTALTSRQADICAIFLTHGHEDHIGAVPYLLDQLGFPPIFGTRLTIGLLRNKLEEYAPRGPVRLELLEPRAAIDLAPFRIEPFRVTHSIADSVGFAIRTPAGLIVHTGDFKLDPTPVDGHGTDLARLAAYGEEGVLALLADSTNVERPGHTLSERAVGEALQEILPACRGGVIVATFASNIHRIQQVVDAAAANGRKILVNGRSMQENIALGRQLGYLRVSDDMLIDLRQARDVPRRELLILSTGSQGEPLSALARIAVDDHKEIRLEPGDTVILSSRFIPGNEKTITDLINQLYRRGAEVFYETTSEIHVSGHAGQEELKQMLALTRPRYFVPVHGEYRHLVKHARLAEAMAMPQLKAVVIDNGQPLLLSQNGMRLEERVESGRVFVDGKGVGDLGAPELRDRSHLANHGLVVVFLALNQHSGEVLFGPELLSRGFAASEENRLYLDQAASVVLQTLQEHSPAARGDLEEVRNEVRKALRRYFSRTIERRPVIIPVIMEF